ncbi:class I SAM-dependent methyltransferase [Romboutsia weinsteinii]|uniref:Class I SAM-dependent methyltransferase n=1 Tax=Romboutsia weinsteinii TaxID=2020949 RepID=A0A371J1K2_9FIRM|nr:class I SAM-dependent methyltransferase [Romboutsia weinsteinii]RDY26546.1 class I SAM-dependent methyltransferase [Romboutsia weinsteinii]
MKDDLKNYLDNTKKPWGILFYKMVWEQLSLVKGMKVLDFGSGFGITANYLAKTNDVTAIEPNIDMLEIREKENNYTQILGGIERLKEIEGEIFDVVVCHNVLEYADEREDIIKEISRILKDKGKLSIVKHNHVGRIMQKVVFENNIDEALMLLDGGDIEVMSFGKVNYYHNDEILKWSRYFNLEKVYGVRTFWALQQDNEIKTELSWQEKMFEVEMRVCEIEEYKNISFFNHVILTKDLNNIDGCM